MDILLIAGLWLDGTVWRDVVGELERLGHRGVPVTLPGQGDGAASATLDDQVDAVVAAVDAASDPCVVVGHSAACTLAWLAADRRPDKVAKVVLIGGFPNAEGEPYAAFFPVVDGVMAFPGWEPFEGPDSADLTDAQKESVAAGAVAVPGDVAEGVVHYTGGDRRFGVPVELVCPEFSPDDAKAWIEGGDVPELARAVWLNYVDIDSGHWPMITKPAELARLIADSAG